MYVWCHIFCAVREILRTSILRAHQLIDWLTDWLTKQLSDWQTDSVTTGWLTYWLTDLLTNWLDEDRTHFKLPHYSLSSYSHHIIFNLIFFIFIYYNKLLFYSYIKLNLYSFVSNKTICMNFLFYFQIWDWYQIRERSQRIWLFQIRWVIIFFVIKFSDSFFLIQNVSVSL